MADGPFHLDSATGKFLLGADGKFAVADACCCGSWSCPTVCTYGYRATWTNMPNFPAEWRIDANYHVCQNGTPDTDSGWVYGGGDYWERGITTHPCECPGWDFGCGSDPGIPIYPPF